MRAAFFAISPSNAPSDVVLAQKSEGALDGQRGIDHHRWEIRDKAVKRPLRRCACTKVRGGTPAIGNLCAKDGAIR